MGGGRVLSARTGLLLRGQILEEAHRSTHRPVHALRHSGGCRLGAKRSHAPAVALPCSCSPGCATARAAVPPPPRRSAAQRVHALPLAFALNCQLPSGRPAGHFQAAGGQAAAQGHGHGLWRLHRAQAGGGGQGPGQGEGQGGGGEHFFVVAVWLWLLRSHGWCALGLLVAKTKAKAKEEAKEDVVSGC